MRTVTEHLNNILNTGIDERVAPAMVAAMGNADAASPLYLYSGGTLGKGSSVPCTTETIFDLASLTKILSTTLIASEAISLGKLALDEQPFRQWPGVHIVDILQHTSGLPAWVNFYRGAIDRHGVVERALATKLEAPSRARMVYSDVGFIALGHLLETRLKENLDVIFDDLSRRLYGNSALGFRTTSRELTSPTGVCEIRRRQLRGEVNDLNAYAQGGVAAHAGLFGNIHDVIKAARFFLDSYRKPKSMTAQVLSTFMKTDGVRPIGFDRAERRGTTEGALSKLAIGHLGFTGTSLWIDPATNAYFVLLTNHLENSPRKNEITQLRKDFHRAAVKLVK